MGDKIKAAQEAMPDADRVDWAHVWEAIGAVLDKEVNPPGSVKAFTSATAPAGWLICDGKTVGKTGSGADYEGDDYKFLYDVIKDTFGGSYDWDGSGKVLLPDLRGIFVRGAGTNGTLSDANGSAFTATLGTYQNDKMQGHEHYHRNWTPLPINTGGDYNPPGSSSSMTTPTAGMLANATDGTPRTGEETNPANLALWHIIKY